MPLLLPPQLERLDSTLPTELHTTHAYVNVTELVVQKRMSNRRVGLMRDRWFSWLNTQCFVFIYAWTCAHREASLLVNAIRY